MIGFSAEATTVGFASVDNSTCMAAKKYERDCSLLRIPYFTRLQICIFVSMHVV